MNLSNKREAIEFIFNDKIDYLINYLNRNGLSSLLYNISHLGIYGNSKIDLDPVKTVDIIVYTSFAPFYAINKRGNKYDIYYLWSDGPKGAQSNERQAARKKMQSKSEWFFIILNEFLEKPLTIVDTRSSRGHYVGSVKLVKDIPGKMEWYKKFNEKENNSIYIRVKKNTSSIGIFEIYRSTSQSVFRDLDEIGIKYNII